MGIMELIQQGHSVMSQSGPAPQWLPATLNLHVDTQGCVSTKTFMKIHYKVGRNDISHVICMLMTDTSTQ